MWCFRWEIAIKLFTILTNETNELENNYNVQFWPEQKWWDFLSLPD